MKYVIVCILSVLACVSAAALDKSGRVVGGIDAFESQFPHQLSLREHGRHVCGGSIIDQYTALTAAHCVFGSTDFGWTIVVGTTLLNSSFGDTYDVNKIIIHENFVSRNLINDIAILKISGPIEYKPRVKPVGLETNYVDPDEQVELSGWGSTFYPGGTIVNKLQYVYLKTISFDECLAKQTSLDVHRTQICTFTKVGQGACHGDSGGPLTLIRSGKLVGIVSGGTPCAVGEPDVYTRISAFIDWIENNRH